VNTEQSKKEPPQEMSHERDIEESISLKATKPDIKIIKNKGETK